MFTNRKQTKKKIEGCTNIFDTGDNYHEIGYELIQLYRSNHKTGFYFFLFYNKDTSLSLRLYVTIFNFVYAMQLFG